jgi:hypothetical protein
MHPWYGHQSQIARDVHQSMQPCARPAKEAAITEAEQKLRELEEQVTLQKEQVTRLKQGKRELERLLCHYGCHAGAFAAALSSRRMQHLVGASAASPAPSDASDLTYPSSNAVASPHRARPSSNAGARVVVHAALPSRAALPHVRSGPRAPCHPVRVMTSDLGPSDQLVTSAASD